MRARRRFSRSCVWGFLFLLVSVTVLPAEIQLVGKAQIPGTARDQSGLSGNLAGGIPHDQLGGFSAIAYSGQDDIYWLLADRGPADGQTQFRCRVHQMRIPLPDAGEAIQPVLLKTVVLSDEQGRPLTGSLKSINGTDPLNSLRFDPEGLRVGRDGALYLSDEYGPRVDRFSPQGRRLGALPLARHFLVEHHHPEPAAEARLNQSGRQPNGGLEGLAISPDGSRLWAIFQRALIQDHGRKGYGVNLRLVEVPLAAGSTGRQYVYQLDHPRSGVNEILAINDHAFLTIERDGEAGEAAQVKKIMLIDLKKAGARPASDVSGVAQLPVKELPDEIQPVSKRVLIDLLDPQWGLKGVGFPEKHEGICFGPNQGNQRLLITVSDNDFQPAKPSTIQMFAISADELPDYHPQQFDR